MFPTNISMVNTSSILRWLKPQIPVYMWRAIATLFAPCCELVISTISFIGSGPYTVSVTLSPAVNFYTTPTFQLLSNGVTVSNTGTYIGGVITFTGVTLTTTSQTFTVLALNSTSTNNGSGVFQGSTSIVATP